MHGVVTEEKVIAAVNGEWAAISGEIRELFRQQWDDPELPAMEFRSSERLAAWLSRSGFEVERKVGGIPTAFRARAGQNAGKVVALLCEYDALPGLDNVAEAKRVGLGKGAGHACGHNHIGPANAGAAIAAARALVKLGVAGEIWVIGCPAEELLWGKIALLRAGVFDGVDAILTSHGDYQTGVLSRPCQSVCSGEFVFSGEAGHGGQQGHRNALLAAEQVVGLAEELVAREFPEIRLRHVLRRAGVMPSITPSEVRVWFTTRGYDFDLTRRAYAALKDVASGTASTAGLGYREQFISESRGYMPNDALGRLLLSEANRLGAPAWSPDDLGFMQSLASACSPGRGLTLRQAVEYFDSGEDYYGQDDGELSWRIPLGRVNWAYPEEVPIHHWAWTALSGNRASDAGPLWASQVLALGAARLLMSPQLIETAQKELAERTRGKRVDMPRIGAMNTLTHSPQSFWDASWTE